MPDNPRILYGSNSHQLLLLKNSGDRSVNRNDPFTRKISYAIAIVVLLLPLFWLGQPPTFDEKGNTVQGGGKLAVLRMENHLSQAQLGEIDPTSESMRLARNSLTVAVVPTRFHRQHGSGILQ